MVCFVEVVGVGLVCFGFGFCCLWVCCGLYVFMLFGFVLLFGGLLFYWFKFIALCGGLVLFAFWVWVFVWVVLVLVGLWFCFTGWAGVVVDLGGLRVEVGLVGVGGLGLGFLGLCGLVLVLGVVVVVVLGGYLGVLWVRWGWYNIVFGWFWVVLVNLVCGLGLGFLFGFWG